MAATLDVMTALFTLFALHAFKTANVPSTAGLIRSSSVLYDNWNGEAVCTTYVDPLIAAATEDSFNRSASTNSS